MENDPNNITGLFLILASAFILGWWANGKYRLAMWRRRRHNRPQKRDSESRKEDSSTPGKRNLADPNVQLEAISKVGFERCRLLNKSEAGILLVLERVVRQLKNGHRVMAQTSLGELIKPRARDENTEKGKNAYAAINSKRLDFAIVDRFGLLVLAVNTKVAATITKSRFFVMR